MVNGPIIGPTTPPAGPVFAGPAGTTGLLTTPSPTTKGLILKGSQIIPPALAPNQISNLWGWFAASALVGYNDGDSITSWPDASGNGYDLTAPTTGDAEPVYKTNVLNGLPIVRCAQNQNLANAQAITQPMTICMTIHMINSAGADGWIIWSPDAHNIEFGKNTSFEYILTASNGNTPILTGAQPDQWDVITLVLNGANSIIYVNSVQQAYGTIAGNDAPNGLALGGISPSTLGGDIAETAIYTGLLSETDRLGLEAYMGNKYALMAGGASKQSANLLESWDADGNPLSGVDGQGRVVNAVIAGPPTGQPPNGTMIYDTTNHKLWIFDGVWKYATFS